MARFFIAFLFCFTLAAQDKIVMRNGSSIEAKVIEITPELVKYRMPSESVLVSISKNSVKEIVFESGRVESFSSLPVIRGPYDWKKVILTNNPDDVKGLVRVKEIRGKSGWGGSMGKSAGTKGARNSLKKKAAKLGAPIVLIQDKSHGMGTTLIGIAYK